MSDDKNRIRTHLAFDHKSEFIHVGNKGKLLEQKAVPVDCELPGDKVLWHIDKSKNVAFFDSKALIGLNICHFVCRPRLILILNLE